MKKLLFVLLIGITACLNAMGPKAELRFRLQTATRQIERQTALDLQNLQELKAHTDGLITLGAVKRLCSKSTKSS